MSQPMTYEGGCLCGNIRYRAVAEPTFPHLCSCTMCRKWSGAPTVAWAEFPLIAIEWIGPKGEPDLFQSSDSVKRGHCSTCGGSICAFDEGGENVSVVIGSLDNPDLIVPNVQHSYSSSKPVWWHPELS